MRRGSSTARGYFSKADDEPLADFFEHELSDEERDRLLSLPGDEMQRELQRLYLTRTKPPDGSPRRGRRSDRRAAGEEESRQELAGEGRQLGPAGSRNSSGVK